MKVAALLRKFNLTLEQYERLEAQQNWACALCFEPEFRIHHANGEVMRLAVDHDHACCPGIRSCGRCVRGLLCYECNLLIGKVEVKPELAKRFADYLSRRPLAEET